MDATELRYSKRWLSFSVNEALGFVVAALAASLLLTAIVIAANGASPKVTAFGFVFQIVSAVTFAVAAIVGVPAYLVVRRLVQFRWLVGVLLGFAVGFLPTLAVLAMEMRAAWGTQNACNLLLLIDRCDMVSVFGEALLSGIAGAVGGFVFVLLAVPRGQDRAAGS